MRSKAFLYIFAAALFAFPTFTPAAAQDSNSCLGRSAFPTGTIEQTLESGGLTREYRVYIPPAYDPAQPTPLVLTLHGFGGNARQQQRESPWDGVAEREGFISVYPQGTGAPARWNAGQSQIEAMERENRGVLGQFLGGFFESVPADDVTFIRELVAQLSQDYCIDPARIYVNGLSNGGGMTNRLACELADVFAAVGTVAGAYTEFEGGCNPLRPVPVIAFHGVEDPIVPYEGNPQISFPAIEDWVRSWAQRDQCDLDSVEVVQLTEAVASTRYTNCADDAEVAFYSIADGGHTWPGGTMGLEFLIGKTSQDIDASETMWAFFSDHPMP